MLIHYCHPGMTPEDYTAVRCGMNISKAIIEGTIDAGIGLENSELLQLLCVKIILRLTSVRCSSQSNRSR